MVYLYEMADFSLDKLVAGRCMGELVRMVLEKLTRHGVLFGGRGSEPLFTPDQFPTKYISEILRFLHRFVLKHFSHIAHIRRILLKKEKFIFTYLQEMKLVKITDEDSYNMVKLLE